MAAVGGRGDDAVMAACRATFGRDLGLQVRMVLTMALLGLLYVVLVVVLLAAGIGMALMLVTENIFAFGDSRAREIMTPRPQLAFVSTDDDVRGVARFAMTSGHTRLPLCKPSGGLDAPVGVIHVKDLVEAALDQRDASLADVARPLARVAESTLLSELLRDLRRQRQHIALVADEHGTTTGLVTLEDVLEELVGEIEDEFDPEASQAITRDGPAAVVDGGASIRLLAQELGVEISEPHEATIGGHLVELLGRVPDVGDVIELDGYRIEISGVDEARITHLRFEPRQR